MTKEEFIFDLKNNGIIVSQDIIYKLELYYNLLIQENKKYNLTAITDKNNVYLKHYYDCLMVTRVIELKNQSICDIGTGAGFPGIVLKIFFPNIKLILIESNSKKCKFLNYIVNELSLDNVTIINSRAEEYARENREKYDIVVSRAVAPLKHLLEYGIPLLKVKGCFVSMKGDIDKEIINYEIYSKKLLFKIEMIDKYFLPYEKSKRSIIKITKMDITSLKYPRKYSEIIKKDI